MPAISSKPPSSADSRSRAPPRPAPPPARGPPPPPPAAPGRERAPRRASQKPPIPVELPDRPNVRDLHVTPHDLETYDALSDSADDPEDRSEERRVGKECRS